MENQNKSIETVPETITLKNSKEKCVKGTDGKCIVGKEKVCLKDTEKRYCIGGKLASDVNSKRFAGCPCKSTKEYEQLE